MENKNLEKIRSIGKDFLEKFLSSDNKKTAAIILGTICVLITIFVVFPSKKTIDFSEYVKCSISGYNGNAEAHAYFDIVALEENFFDSPYNSNNDDERVVLQTITVEMENFENLSNGDVVVINAVYDKKKLNKAGYKLKNTTYEYFVKDLKDAKNIELLENLTLTFSGISGNGKCTIDKSKWWQLPEYEQYKTFINGVGLRAEIERIDGTKSTETFVLPENFKNGDKIKLTLTYNEEYATRYLIDLKELTKEYVVSGLGEYLNPSDELSENDILRIKEMTESKYIKTMSDKMQSDYILYAMGYRNSNVNSVKLDKYMLITNDTSNVLVTVYKAKFDKYWAEELQSSIDVYYYFTYPDVYRENGEINFPNDSHYSNYYYNLYKDMSYEEANQSFLKSYSSGYTIKEYKK